MPARSLRWSAPWTRCRSALLSDMAAVAGNSAYYVIGSRLHPARACPGQHSWLLCLRGGLLGGLAGWQGGSMLNTADHTLYTA